MSWLIQHKFLLTNFYSRDTGLSAALRGLTGILVAHFMYSIVRSQAGAGRNGYASKKSRTGIPGKQEVLPGASQDVLDNECVLHI